jgi:hypothetical protein
VLGALGVVYLHYQLLHSTKENFKKNLRTLLVLKKICKDLQYIVEGKKIRLMLALLDSWLLDAQQAYFKLAMLNNCKQAMEQPSNVNSFTLLWHALESAIICIYPKLIKIDKVYVIGSLQNMQCFLLPHFFKKTRKFSKFSPQACCRHIHPEGIYP